jgi:hypothetical protein
MDLGNSSGSAAWYQALSYNSFVSQNEASWLAKRRSIILPCFRLGGANLVASLAIGIVLPLKGLASAGPFFIGLFLYVSGRFWPVQRSITFLSKPLGA